MHLLKPYRQNKTIASNPKDNYKNPILNVMHLQKKEFMMMETKPIQLIIKL